MKNEGARIRVTTYGAVATLALVALWVTILAYGYSAPDSLLGRLIRLPLAVPIIIFGSSFLLVPVEWYFKRRGKPLFVREHDA
jgi:ABC-type sulfate transport system permease component